LVLRFQELSGSGVSDDTEALHEVSLAHTDTGILNHDGVVSPVWNDADAHVLLCLELLWCGDRQLSDLVKCITGVGDQLSQEDFFVGVDRIDDYFHQSSG
jgi:hypothetical protein